MSKTFKSALSTDKELRITGGPERVCFAQRAHNGMESFVFIDNTEAPALALAILEAAGVVHHDPDDTPYEKSERTENMGALNMSAFYLAKHVNDAEKVEFLAKEQAKLEAEALDLFNARQEAINSVDWEPYKDFATEDSKQTWLAVARRARELNKEEK